jgi:pimeloyl-ACP methyl ester carboxylesterase
MANLKVTTGYSKNGLPYARMDGGPRTLVVFDGLDFSHKPPSGMELRLMSGFVKKLAGDFTVYQVRRKPGLPEGYSMSDMSDDYAVMIKEELGGPVDIMGISTGGPIAQHFAVDHSDLVDHLVLAMAGYRLTDNGRQLQRRIAELVREGRWRAAAAAMATALTTGVAGLLLKSVFWLFGKSGFGSPASTSDGLVEIEAEDRHDFKERLAEIKVPTLVIGGDKDFFYPIRETAEGIPDSKLVLYEGVGHTAIRKREFGEDVLAFLTGDTGGEVEK